jgi:hypothetical protein
MDGLTRVLSTLDLFSFSVYDWIVHDRADFDPIGEAEEAHRKQHKQLVGAAPGLLEAVMLAAEESIDCLDVGDDRRVGLEPGSPPCWRAVLLQEVIPVRDVWVDVCDFLAQFPWLDAGVDDVHAEEGPRDQHLARLFVLKEFHLSNNAAFRT